MLDKESLNEPNPEFNPIIWLVCFITSVICLVNIAKG